MARRQLLALLLDPVGNHPYLLVEVAVQHDAVIDDCGDAVEQHAARAELRGLCVAGCAGQEQGQDR